MARTICFYFMLVAPYPFFVILFPSLISSLTIYIHSIYSFWHFAGLPKVLKLCKLNNNIALYIHSIRSQLSSKYLVYYMFFYYSDFKFFIVWRQTSFLIWQRCVREVVCRGKFCSSKDLVFLERRVFHFQKVIFRHYLKIVVFWANYEASRNARAQISGATHLAKLVKTETDISGRKHNLHEEGLTLS